MRHYSKSYNSKESRRKRSERGRHAVSCRKDRQQRETLTPQSEDLFELVVRNLVSGRETLVQINRGTRANNFQFIIDGKPWKLCGMRQAEGLILSSLAKAQ